MLVRTLKKGINGLSTTSHWIEHFAGNRRVMLEGLCKTEALGRSVGEAWTDTTISRERRGMFVRGGAE